MTNNQRPHIILIVLDTHRRDRISSYGYHRNTTPNIDAFAREATIFNRAISPAQWTIPAHASIFTGEYPTTHQTLQPHSFLDTRFDSLAKLLALNGYQTTGFCNNPLLGILNNGLKQGFKKFYNYCGAVPSVPKRANHLPTPLNNIWEWYTQQLRKASYPVQNAFAHSDLLFQLSLHPKFVAFWSKVGNFKGDTAQSIGDVFDFVRKNQTNPAPQFVFLNLMETHLPYRPPDNFIDKFAPYFKEDRQTRDFLRRYNVETFRWLLPIEGSLPSMEESLHNDIYDAEVNYQDHLLEPLLEFLSKAKNTLTIIVADHGEGIGEHNFMGHSFVTYQELIHVPLIIKFPDELGMGQRTNTTVSTRRIFHTALAAASAQVHESNYRPASPVKSLSLAQTVQGHDPEQETVMVEAYPPNNFLSVMHKHTPHLINLFHCTSNRWALYDKENKLVRIDGVKNELYNIATDPVETVDIINQHPQQAADMSDKLHALIAQAIKRQLNNWQPTHTAIEDENITKQLKALGYID